MGETESGVGVEGEGAKERGGGVGGGGGGGEEGWWWWGGGGGGSKLLLPSRKRGKSLSLPQSPIFPFPMSWTDVLATCYS